jgi:hypothetical protein
MALRSGLPILLIASTSFALPRPNSQVRAGANHHLGDASYIAAYGHPPGAHAGERDRMQRHLAFVRDWLASRPATRPALVARRAEILGYLDVYIAKRTTPKNDHVPWRTPVFIDDQGTICAVGYLIEQSVDPALPRRIARAHRYDFIEDIARAMPEVQAWIDGSGFTLEEIASIQPAYSEPNSKTWRTWDLAKHPPADGPYDQLGSRGVFRHGRMDGDWVAYAKPEDGGAEVIVGRGHMKHGSGPWVSYDAAGAKLGEGRYANNRAEGPWKLYHPSGNLAAEGAFSHGDRTGRWRFYYDTPDRTPIAIGRFAGRGGRVVGTWQHFDQRGELLATTWAATPAQWHDTDWDIDGGSGFMLDIVARPGEVKHASHQGTVNSVPVALDMHDVRPGRLEARPQRRRVARGGLPVEREAQGPGTARRPRRAARRALPGRAAPGEPDVRGAGRRRGRRGRSGVRAAGRGVRRADRRARCRDDSARSGARADPCVRAQRRARRSGRRGPRRRAVRRRSRAARDGDRPEPRAGREHGDVSRVATHRWPVRRAVRRDGRPGDLAMGL